MTEFKRLHDLAVGENWVGDSQRLLYLCLTNAPAKNNHLVEFGGVIPPAYKEAAKLLFQILAQSDDEELKSPQGYDMAAERICSACLEYIQTVMAPEEFASFVVSTPTRKFKSVLEDIQLMLKDA